MHDNTKTTKLHTVPLPNGETMAYRCSGKGGLPVILVHGNMTSSLHFDLLMEKMPSAYTVYAVDLRGFGGSSYHTPIDSISDFVKDLNLFTDIMDLDRFILIGWSMGGGVSMAFSAMWPDRVTQLILIESMGVNGFTILNKKTNQKLKTRQDIQNDRSLNHLSDALEREDRIYLKQFWRKLVYTKNEPDTEKFDIYMKDVLTQKNLMDVYYALISFNISGGSDAFLSDAGLNIHNIKMPVLVIQGDRDLVNTVDTGTNTARAIGTNARLEIIQDCGHSPFIDQLDTVCGLIISFMAKRAQTGP